MAAVIAAFHTVCVSPADLCAVSGSRSASQAETSDLPDGPGMRIVELRCLTCHRAEIIRAQRLSTAAWQRELDKMIGWGAQVSERERNELLSYLSGMFGEKEVVITDVNDEAAPSLLMRCLVCHDMRLIEQQRLTARGWEREVDKMRGWGAAVTDAEAVVIGRYLAKQYPPER
jgi:hypothetical protein